VKAAFQTRAVEMCGVQVTRVLNGTVKTDVELAESIQS
jgi:hypothetical protein